MRRLATMMATALAAVLFAAPVAQACGFLVAENGAVRLGRTTTFVAWEDGIQRYITNFTFEGDVESFGSLIPLPSEPTDVRRAGDWTLQRLQIEVQRDDAILNFGALKTFAAAEDGAQVILQTTVDSLDIVVLKGGAEDVFDWVNENGFELPDAPETRHMLDFYASRSPYFLAAKFDLDRAAQDSFTAGDGVPVQITMPTKRPWVPLHILHGVQPDSSIVNADIFLLTPERPELLHGVGLEVGVSEEASDLLLDDLRSDENMEWVPTEGWFTHLILETDAANLTYDLSVGVDGKAPSFVDAGLTRVEPTDDSLQAFGLTRSGWAQGIAGLVMAALLGGLVGGFVTRRTEV